MEGSFQRDLRKLSGTNLYVYARSNPANLVDPAGLQEEREFDKWDDEKLIAEAKKLADELDRMNPADPRFPEKADRLRNMVDAVNKRIDGYAGERKARGPIDPETRKKWNELRSARAKVGLQLHRNANRYTIFVGRKAERFRALMRLRAGGRLPDHGAKYLPG